MLYQYDQLSAGFLGPEQLPPEPIMFLGHVIDHFAEIVFAVDADLRMPFELIVADIQLLRDVPDAGAVEITDYVADDFGMFAGINDQAKGSPSSLLSGKSINPSDAVEARSVV